MSAFYFDVLHALMYNSKDESQDIIAYRENWNAAGQYIGMCTNWNGNVIAGGPDYEMAPFLYIKTAQNKIVPWFPSQTDQLADDWVIKIIRTVKEEIIDSKTIASAMEMIKIHVTLQPDNNVRFHLFARYVNIFKAAGIDEEIAKKAANTLYFNLFGVTVELPVQLPIPVEAPIDLSQAYYTVQSAVMKDPDYAWSWHCNVAVALIDATVDHEAANKVAVEFMKDVFDTDTSKNANCQYNDITEDKAKELMNSFLELNPDMKDVIETEVKPDEEKLYSEMNDNIQSNFSDPVHDVE